MLNTSVHKLFSLVLVCAFALAHVSTSRVKAQTAKNLTPKGHLVIIGGGPRPEAIMKRIVALAGGEKSNIVVIPMASGEPLETARAQMEQLQKFGAAKVDALICTKETADHDSNTAKLRAATGIFFSGGDQTRLTSALQGTKLLAEVHGVYKRGGVLSGTSAGAAVQSKIMLTGDERVNKDTNNPYGVVQKGNIATAEGFGFLTSAIIDQHFVKRKRQNRLLTLVLEYPHLLGIGIDEATCIIVKPDNTCEVLGDATVQVFDARAAKRITTDAAGNLSAQNIRIDIVPSGGMFTLPRGRASHILLPKTNAQTKSLNYKQ
jgi:cyanophycinase